MVKRPRHGHWRALWLQTIGTRWDLVVDLRNTLVSRLLFRRQLKVFRGTAQGRHMVETLAALIDAEPQDAAPRLWLSPKWIAQAGAELPPDVPLLALAPGANTAAKRWPTERFAALAARLLGPDGILAGGTAILLGAADERDCAAPILAALPPGRVIDLIGQTEPLAAAAYIRRADLYIGNDSGLTHLAAAVGAPTLALFGPGLPGRYRPWGAKADYLIANEDRNRTVDLCKIDPIQAQAEMEKISVDQTVNAAELLYRRTLTP